MVFSNINRLYIGLLIAVVVLLAYLFNLDKLFLLLLLLLITYEFICMKITNIFFIIFIPIISIMALLFLTYSLFEYLFFIQLIFIFSILFFDYYKKVIFFLSLYLFYINLFYIINLDRNLFYLLFLISFFNDTVAFISGRYLRGPLILPKVSPNKTWSGTTISFSLTTLLLFTLNFNIIISMVISILLFIGDIFFSYMKRYLNIKDFSQILGSHGGILDRLDSMFFVAIFLQIYLVYFV